MVLKAERRQPFICLARTRGKEGWRRLGRAAGPTSWGAFVLSRKDFCPARGYMRCTGACTPVFGHFWPIGRVFNTAYCDACLIGKSDSLNVAQERGFCDAVCRHRSALQPLRWRCRNSIARNRGPRALTYGDWTGLATGIATFQQWRQGAGTGVDRNGTAVRMHAPTLTACRHSEMPVSGRRKALPIRDRHSARCAFPSRSCKLITMYRV